MNPDNTHCPKCNAPVGGELDRVWNDEANAFICVQCAFLARMITTPPRPWTEIMTDETPPFTTIPPFNIMIAEGKITVPKCDMQRLLQTISIEVILVKDRDGNPIARKILNPPHELMTAGRYNNLDINFLPHEKPCLGDTIHFLDKDGKEVRWANATTIVRDLQPRLPHTIPSKFDG